MAKISPYTSGKLKDLKVGLSSYSEGKTSLQITGSVGIGTTNPYASVGASNTSVLAVGILTANKIFSTDFGQFTGGGILVDNIVGLALSVSGISTLANVKIADGNVAIGTDDATAQVSASNTSILAVGILTANRIFSTVYGQFTGGSVVADNIVGVGLSISGISTLGITSTTDLTAQDLNVTGIASVGAAITMYGATGIISATQFYGDGSKLSNLPSLTGVSTGVGTFIASAGVSTNIDSFAYASLDYKLAEYSLHFMNGSNIQAERIIVMQDNTTAYSNEFAIMSSSDLLISVGATVSGSNVVIQATPETGVSGLTTYRWRREVQE